MKIVYCTPYQGEEDIVTALLPGHEVVFCLDPLGETDGVPNQFRDAQVLSVFVNSRVTAEMIDSMPQLRHIALRSTGFDHVDVAHATSKGIVVSYVPHYGSQTVAEHTFALILTISRKIHSMHGLLRTSGGVDVTEHEGFDLCGKTIGVIGTGAIGKRVCEIAQGFHMNVRAFDLYPDAEFAKTHGVTYGSLEEVLAASDIITLHVPATTENHHLLNEGSIAHIKRGAYVINTARGSLIDTVALIHALKSGHLAGAGLDVYEGEEYLKDELKLVDSREELNMHIWRAFAAEHELLDMANVVMTPHMAFNTKEAKREITETTIANMQKWEKQENFYAVSLPTS
jgi:D-lactate dehydrogenase